MKSGQGPDVLTSSYLRGNKAFLDVRKAYNRVERRVMAEDEMVWSPGRI